MNTLLFSVEESQVNMDGGYSFATEPTDYSVLYHVHKISGRSLAVIDFKTVKRQEWRDGKAYWVDARIDAPILAKLEKQLQDEVDYKEETDIAELAEERRRRA